MVDWAGLGISINREYGAGADGLQSIHEYTEQRLIDESCNVVYCDHGALEIADYISVKEESDYIRVTLYHCKATKERRAGARVKDFYEVCGQVEKSVDWVNDIQKMRERMEYRLRFAREDGNDRFVVGNLEEMERIVAAAKRKRVLYRIVIVQPGLSQAAISAEIQLILGASEGYIGRLGCDKLLVIASA